MSTRIEKTFVRSLADRLWAYRDNTFQNRDSLFEETNRRGDRPPVFTREAAANNVLVHPDLTADKALVVRSVIPPWKRHRWFRSMKSSQAMVQSIFANLLVLDRLKVLRTIVSSDGVRVFDSVGEAGTELQIEKSIGYLGEAVGRTTEVDVFITTNKRLALECKFCEVDIGRCSRTRLSPLDRDYCDGTYTRQQNRQSLCALTEIGIRYWEFIPLLFHWSNLSALSPCPLSTTYQLVRNVLAACVDESGRITDNGGVAILLVDSRNPAFHAGGTGRVAFNQVKAALRQSERLQLCTWQNVLEAMRADTSLKGLTEQFRAKYDL